MFTERAILHVDMDAFYASVEQHDDPTLRNQPVIVGGLGNRGVVAAASYEVRRFGVRSAMPMREALQRCPHAICVAPRFHRYQAISQQVFAIFREITPLVQGLSLDEAFLDVTASQSALGPAAEIATHIKQRIRAVTGLTASVGVAPSKLVAKIASDLRKPDGLVVVYPHEVSAFLDPLPIQKLFGIGAKTAARLTEAGLKTFQEVRLANEARLRPLLGSHALTIRQRASGNDTRAVEPDTDAKQISAETTFDIDLRDERRLEAHLVRLADRVATRVRRHHWIASRITLKIRRADFKTYTRQRLLKPATQETRALTDAARELLAEWRTEQPDAAIRLLGVGAGDLQIERQLELFAPQVSKRNRELDATIDSIREKFGGLALTRASNLDTPTRPLRPPKPSLDE
jgi:DNA polymerase-4